MRIAQITAVFPPYKGGIGQVAYHYAREMDALEQQVTVYTPNYGEGKGEFKFNTRYLRPWFKWGRAGFCPQLFFKLKKYDVVQLHYPSFGMAEVVWLAKKIFRNKFKLIIFYHHDVVGSKTLGRFFRWYTKYFLPLILKAADNVLVSSFDYAENSDVRQYLNAHRNKFKELPFGVTERFIQKSRNNDIIYKFDINPDAKIILFVGGLDRNHYFKGADRLIMACSELKIDNWHLILVGGGNLIPELKSLVHLKGLNDQVTFAGFISDEYLPSYYQLADVFVLPSIDRSEAFGIVLIEAMACGVPVIASDLPGVRSVVEPGDTGLLAPPKDIEKLKQDISQLLMDEVMHADMSKKAAQLVKEKYQWTEIGKKLLSIYKNC